ncbi:MAG: hypothetical protein U0931_36030 [Vulcanimicrobiota bacterium]
MQNRLQDRLQHAVDCFQAGQFELDTMLQAVDSEIKTIDSVHSSCSQSEVGIAFAEALELYLDCLYQLEELMQTGGCIPPSDLEAILVQAAEANQLLDELTEEAEQPEALVLGVI